MIGDYHRSQPTRAAINVFGGRKKFGGLDFNVVITTVPPNTYIYEIKLYFILNGTTERFLNQGFKSKL
jgi:hypothetical protein